MLYALPFLAALAAASPAMVPKHILKQVPSGWKFHSDAPSSLKMDMHIGLKEQNLDELEKRLTAMSDPSHPDYGKHMSKEQVEALTAPSKATVDSVTAWLASNGVKAGTVSSGFMAVTMTAEQAEKMLDTKYGVYYNADKKRYTVRTTKYSLPESLHGSIATVQPTTMFSDMNMFDSRARKETRVSFARDLESRQSGCSGFGITPSCLRSLYNINYTAQQNKTTVGITGYLGEVASSSDLSQFLQQYTQVPSDATFDVQLVNGGSNDGQGTTEADLDTQYVMALTYPISNIFYETGGQPPFNPDASTQTNSNEPYMDWLNYLAGLDSVPQTISSSYGDNEQTVPKDYADSVCDQFMKLAARGVSVLVSSGDGGVSGGQPSQCISNDGSNKRMFLPTFPASCPQGVTAVGGTTQTGPEVAAQLSSGGFSNYYSAPSYQSSQTKAYISSIGSQYSGLYNPSGRGIPDVAAQAESFDVVIDGGSSLVSGTSAAAPTVAGIVALLNDYLVSQGRAPLGFLNPFLYGKGVTGLNDIVSGNNPGCNTNGFSAKKGWDPVTGLGTPDFGKLKSLV